MLLELVVQFPSVMMKTQHRYLAQSLLLEAGKGHPGHLVVPQKLVQVKPLQEEGVGAGAGAGLPVVT